MVSRRSADQGSVLVLTLIFTVVLSLVVLALAEYAGTGLRTSRVATMRTETTADASSAVSWAIERFAKKELTPDADCGDAPDYLPIAVPTGLISGATVELACRETTPITGEPVVHLVATTTSGPSTRVVEATVEVPRYTHGARVADWRVDLPIAVPQLVTTTTTAATTTSTTTTSTTTTTTDPASPPETTTTTTTVAPRPTCQFLITSAEADGKTGTGKLSISNVGGGEFTGWSVRVSRSGSVSAWSFSWDSAVQIGSIGSDITVDNGAANATVAAGEVDQFNIGASMWSNQKDSIVAGQALTCTFLSPPP